MENWEYHKTYSGTPQGGILSPILANIYLHELDKKIEQLRSDFSKSAPNSCSYEYSKVVREIRKLRKQYGKLTEDTEKKSLLKEIHKLEMQKRKLPYKDATGKKIVYVRYADDFLIGVSGSREDCEKIKQELTEFISERLKLELSDEKTRITHSSLNARFLGYDINVRRNNQTKRTAKGTVQRTLNPILTIQHLHSRTKFEDRLKARKCELCGSEDSEHYEIHHVNKVKNLKGKTLWEQIMISKKRKTLVVCRECHKRIHGKQS